MNTKNLQNLIFYRYRYAIAYLLVLFSAGTALAYKLGSLLPGISQQEAQQGLLIVKDSTTIFEKGVFLPYNLVQALAIEFFGSSALALRATSVFFAVLTLAIMFFLIHSWHKDKIALASVLFLSTSSWFLNFARSGTPYIYLAFSLSLLFLSGALIRHSKHPRLALISAAFAVPLALYAPYMIYLLALYLILYRKQFWRILCEMDKSNIAVVSLIGITAIIPLIYALSHNTDNLRQWLGFNGDLTSVSDYFHNILLSIRHILWNSQTNSEFHLGKLAMLDIFTSTMAALGLFHYEKHFSLLRTRFIIYGLAIMLLVFGLSSSETTYFIAAPIIYILAATGIVTLLNQWNKIFPINPFARTLALLPLAFAVLITSQYHIDRYFSAWAQSPETRLTYSVEPELLRKSISISDSNKILIVTDSSQSSAINYLLDEYKSKKNILVVKSLEASQILESKNSYTKIYLDSDIDGTLRQKLDSTSTKSININSPRSSKPKAYTIYSRNN